MAKPIIGQLATGSATSAVASTRKRAPVSLVKLNWNVPSPSGARRGSLSALVGRFFYPTFGSDLTAEERAARRCRSQ